MKKFLTFLTLLTAISWLPIGVHAQEELTVADGTTTNEYFPVYSWYGDADVKTQMVYPADMLAGMVGSEISGMTFYVSSGSYSIEGDVTVSLGTVDNFTPFDESFLTASLTEVFSAEASPSGDLLVVTFS